MTSIFDDTSDPAADAAAIATARDCSPRARHLTFLLDGTTYAIPVAHVLRVLDDRCIVPVIRAPKHQLGVLIYDGALIAVLDLRHFFGVRARAPRATSAVIVVQVPSETGVEIVGLAVDRGLAVTEVESLAGLDGNPRALVSRLDLAAPADDETSHRR